jgi:c-di-GMP-binding flagellar brake protein YcgR
MSFKHHRLSLRHPNALDVTLHVGGGGQSLRGKSVDLSKGGIFVVLSQRIPEGRRVDIVIESPVTEAPVVASGIVVHTVASVGVGIRFSQLSDRTREAIDALIESLKRTA